MSVPPAVAGGKPLEWVPPATAGGTDTYFFGDVVGIGLFLNGSTSGNTFTPVVNFNGAAAIPLGYVNSTMYAVYPS